MTLISGDTAIETERLILRRMAPDDLAFYTAIHADPDVALYISHGKPRTPEETRSWLDAILQSYDTLSMGQLAVTLRSTGALLGRCGIARLETDTAIGPDGVKAGYYFPHRAPQGSNPLVEAELGYTFDRAAWSNGYASEAVAGVLEYVRANRSDLRVVSLIMTENRRSLRVARRFGAQLVDRVGIFGRVFDRYEYP